MQSSRLPFRSTRLISLLIAMNLGIVANTLPGRSQSVSPTHSPDLTEQTEIFFNAPRPPRQGTPGGRSQGGASRGSCQAYETLTALVPTTEGIVWGMTTQQHPTLWFYLPQSLSAETSLEFVVQDDTDNYLYKTLFTAPDTAAGLIHIAVPTSAPPLEPNKSYSWTLAIYCNPDEPSESVFVTGTIQYSELSEALQTQLDAASPLEQAKLYAANGIWHDALNTLAAQYQTQPNNDRLIKAWSELLQQAGIEALSTAPFGSYCTL